MANHAALQMTQFGNRFNPTKDCAGHAVLDQFPLPARVGDYVKWGS